MTESDSFTEVKIEHSLGFTSYKPSPQPSNLIQNNPAFTIIKDNNQSET
jgi:hypothetical protein